MSIDRSLACNEVVEVVSAAVAECAGRMPVISGCGYGTAMALELARAVQAAGADGILLLPMDPSTGGIVENHDRVAA